MAIRLSLNARDVTLLPETRPAPQPNAAPERSFSIEQGEDGYRLTFDGRRVIVPDEAIRDLLTKVAEGTPVEWRHSSNAEIQATFRPLNRILQSLNSTPAYQLFLSGFHIADAIGMLDLDQVGEDAVVDSFRYLVGPLLWMGGKKGRLFFIPDGYVNDPVTLLELMANGKLFSADFFLSNAEGEHHQGNKLFTPYALPMGFNTKVRPETEDTWRRISDLIRRYIGT